MTNYNKWDVIVGCIIASFLSNDKKQELIDLVRMCEERITFNDDNV